MKNLSFSRKKSLVACVLYLLASIFIMSTIYIVIYIYNIPTNSIIYTPGEVYPISSSVEIEGDTNIHKVSVKMVTVEDRIDFLKYMWRNKKIYLDYSWSEYDSIKEMVLDSIKVKKDNLIAQREKFNVFLDYAERNYEENELEKFLLPIKGHKEVVGNSDSLATMLGLIGVYEDKSWIHSNEKIVITGNIDKDGNVLPVGNVALKAVTAENSKGDVFIVPKEQQDDTYKFLDENSSMKIIPVTNIKEIVKWLDTNIM